MRRYRLIPLVLCLIMIMTVGCAKAEKEAAAAKTKDVTVKTTEKKEAADAEEKDGTAKTAEKKEAASDGDVDVDLTSLSSTMVYAEVYSIMTRPEEYAGKTIKMEGPYYSSKSEETDQYYHFVIIEDATACCQQGLEFIWNGDHTYPDDYPKDQQKVEIVGEYKSYDELGQTYYYLDVDEIKQV